MKKRKEKDWDIVEDESHLYEEHRRKEGQSYPPYFNSEEEYLLAKYHIDLALEQIASMYANERCHRDSFLTEDDYISHKEELKDREIVMLLSVRDYFPSQIDGLINTLD